VHAPPTHAEAVQAAGALHEPSDWHDSTPLPEQVVCKGAHTPWQAPDTHVWLVQAAAVPQLPVASHVWTPLLEHCFAAGAQTP
jgi:hypothetical protein